MRAYLERARRAVEEWRSRHPRAGAAVTLAVRTTKSAVRVRIIGLAAESAFFALLSLPALLLGLIGTLGHLRSVLGQGTVLEIRAWILDLATTALTAQTVDRVVAPLVDDFLRGAQGGILSLTFLVSLWSGSRAMNVFIESITIAYGLSEVRGYFRQRALAFIGYLGGLLFALVVLPVLVAGPNLVRDLLPMAGDYLHLAYWPVVGLLSLTCLLALYTLSVPVRTPLWRHLPGSVVAMVVLLLGSVLLRVYLDASFGQVTIYGSLAAPIAILAWFYVMALAVLIGSLLNAEIDAMWPTATTAEARAEIAARRHARATRLVRRHEEALRTVVERGDARKDEDEIAEEAEASEAEEVLERIGGDADGAARGPAGAAPAEEADSDAAQIPAAGGPGEEEPGDASPGNEGEPRTEEPDVPTQRPVRGSEADGGGRPGADPLVSRKGE
ncbi:membrane protein [Spinactinospora alkalitolerans]|uniref:Membrane protein n=1 Tax=Spinactinospora alkalitolerans TaxID=687207 RepID=A0A852TQY4_9ACTN|nr:YihY/virulence factor BrkB family protein [Spinactinospora alkalitolerans]NYE46806.1 membrane protein [Spinactinospora alkalitolerans]